jgi:hypothetical protein
MNITNLTEKYFEKSKSDESFKTLFKDLFKSGAYAVLKEINRLNFPAFTLLDDNDLSKQGFVNMLLNRMVDEDDIRFGKDLHFTEYKAYHENEPHVKRPYENDDKNWFLVQLDNGRLDIAKNVWTDDKKETSIWKNQDGKVLNNVLNWRPIYPNGEV